MCVVKVGSVLFDLLVSQAASAAHGCSYACMVGYVWLYFDLLAKIHAKIYFLNLKIAIAVFILFDIINV